jgi:hypothetical protein
MSRSQNQTQHHHRCRPLFMGDIEIHIPKPPLSLGFLTPFDAY